MEDLETICQIAEEVLEELCCGDGFYRYDEEGDRLPAGGCQRADEAEPEVWDYMRFHKRTEDQGMTTGEIIKMSAGTIQAKYLADILPKARNILRRGTAIPHLVVAAEVPDSVLDEILTLLWQGKLLWWGHVREHIRARESTKEGSL